MEAINNNSTMEEVQMLRDRVRQLEDELEEMKRTNVGREKIPKMSAEVVDSNPYRSGYRTAYSYKMS